jgi:hypothetical protein
MAHQNSNETSKSVKIARFRLQRFGLLAKWEERLSDRKTKGNATAALFPTLKRNNSESPLGGVVSLE